MRSPLFIRLPGRRFIGNSEAQKEGQGVLSLDPPCLFFYLLGFPGLLGACWVWFNTCAVDNSIQAVSIGNISLLVAFARF